MMGQDAANGSAFLGRWALPVRALEGYLTATSWLRQGPDFLIIGAQRSGTTSLYRYLCGHPHVMPTLTSKGVHYFDTSWYDRSPEWYRGHFPIRSYRSYRARRSGGAVVTGEASPYYVFHPHVPARVAQVLPDVRLILMLREPASRAFSHYQHEREGGFEVLETFEEAIDAEEERLKAELARMLASPQYNSFAHQHFSYLARGRYDEQLDRWLRFFPRDQLLVITSESFFEDPRLEYDRVIEFLGLPSAPTIPFRRYNVNPSSDMSPSTRRRLQRYFRPHNQALFTALGDSPAWGGHIDWPE